MRILLLIIQGAVLTLPSSPTYSSPFFCFLQLASDILPILRSRATASHSTGSNDPRGIMDPSLRLVLDELNQHLDDLDNRLAARNSDLVDKGLSAKHWFPHVQLTANHRRTAAIAHRPSCLKKAVIISIRIATARGVWPTRNRDLFENIQY